MAAKYDLDAEHVSFVTGSGKTTNKVQNIVEEAETLQEEEAVEHSGGAFEGATRSASVDVDSDADRDSGTAEATSEGDSEAEASEDDTDDSQAGLTDF